MTKFEKQLLISCFTDWRWWRDGITFMLFMAVIFAWFIILAA